MSFPAIKGQQANDEYYIVMCPLKRLKRIFSFDEGQLPVDKRAQRIINEERIPDIANYILDNRDQLDKLYHNDDRAIYFYFDA